MKKYELTEETKVVDGRTVRRIKALRDFGQVKAGDLGGFVASEKNLSQEGNCWVCDEASVYDGAWVSSNARICDNVRVYGVDVWVVGSGTIEGDIRLH